MNSFKDYAGARQDAGTQRARQHERARRVEAVMRYAPRSQRGDPDQRRVPCDRMSTDQHGAGRVKTSSDPFKALTEIAGMGPPGLADAGERGQRTRATGHEIGASMQRRQLPVQEGVVVERRKRVDRRDHRGAVQAPLRNVIPLRHTDVGSCVALALCQGREGLGERPRRHLGRAPRAGHR